MEPAKHHNILPIIHPVSISVGVAQALLAAGAAVGAKSSTGHTALHFATLARHRARDHTLEVRVGVSQVSVALHGVARLACLRWEGWVHRCEALASGLQAG
jgi:hypothetical protein